MILDDSDRRTTSSFEPRMDSDPDELLCELASTLIAPNEAGRRISPTSGRTEKKPGVTNVEEFVEGARMQTLAYRHS